jgi:aspartate/methionine/tyrosine aminotransferase
MKEIDLSIGAPAEVVSEAVKNVLQNSQWSVGYPLAAGSEKFKKAVQDWAKQLLEIDILPSQVMPVAGAKEFVATLAWVLDLNKDSTIAIPEFCYPTYQDAAAKIKAKVVRYKTVDDLKSLEKLDLIWVNSPNNPTGAIFNEAKLTEFVKLAQVKSAYLVSDETYLEAAKERCAPSGLKIALSLGYQKALGLYSLSKRNALAAFRVGYVIGQSELIEELISKRRKLGLLANSPATEVASELLKDFTYPEKLRAKFLKNRELLLPILQSKGFTNHAEAGMFLWLSSNENGEKVVEKFAKLNIKVAPGIWYGPSATNFIRISLTASDEDMQDALARFSDF